MNGHIAFHEALSARLDLIKPSRTDISNFLKNHPFVLTDHMEKLVQCLHRRGTLVYFVSGGFRQVYCCSHLCCFSVTRLRISITGYLAQMIEPIATSLQVPLHRIYANNLLFNEDTGEYVSFDKKAPTSRDGGKAQVIQNLKAWHRYASIVMVGDGVTDLQARPPADVFIGYGGVVTRQRVKDEADWYITDFKVQYLFSHHN
jgi:phosphoserine phosphatase